MAGSLIKNPGGTLAPSGGYVAGKAHLVQAAHARLASPGIGMEAGATAGDVLRLMMQGLFMGPQIVGEALKVNWSLNKFDDFSFQLFFLFCTIQTYFFFSFAF